MSLTAAAGDKTPNYPGHKGTSETPPPMARFVGPWASKEIDMPAAAPAAEKLEKMTLCALNLAMALLKNYRLAPRLSADGGEGSGNFGHAGRPGEVGGSGGGGQTESAGQRTGAEEKQKKIASVKIDFGKDNLLPGLNEEDLAELGKEDKPVKFKKETIARNKIEHPEVPDDEYNEILGNALYNSPLKFRGKNYENGQANEYINFVSINTVKGKNALTLLELADAKDAYEIVHLFKLSDKKLQKMTAYLKDEK
jgi:hypothetical protein